MEKGRAEEELKKKLEQRRRKRKEIEAAKRQVIPETAANANPAGDATVGSTAAGPHEPSTPPLPPVLTRFDTDDVVLNLTPSEGEDAFVQVAEARTKVARGILRSRQGSGLHLPPDSPASALIPESIVSENVQTSQEVCEVDSGAGALHEAVSFDSNEVAVTAKAPPSPARDDDENYALQSHLQGNPECADLPSSTAEAVTNADDVEGDLEIENDRQARRQEEAVAARSAALRRWAARAQTRVRQTSDAGAEVALAPEAMDSQSVYSTSTQQEEFAAEKVQTKPEATPPASLASGDTVTSGTRTERLQSRVDSLKRLFAATQDEDSVVSAQASSTAEGIDTTGSEHPPPPKGYADDIYKQAGSPIGVASANVPWVPKREFEGSASATVAIESERLLLQENMEEAHTQGQDGTSPPRLGRGFLNGFEEADPDQEGVTVQSANRNRTFMSDSAPPPRRAFFDMIEEADPDEEDFWVQQPTISRGGTATRAGPSLGQIAHDIQFIEEIPSDDDIE